MSTATLQDSSSSGKLYHVGQDSKQNQQTFIIAENV
jgi:hypothetical protein